MRLIVSDDVVVECVDREIRIGHTEQFEFGRGLAPVVVPQLLDGLAHLDRSTAEIAGLPSRGAGNLELSYTQLVVAAGADGTVRVLSVNAFLEPVATAWLTAVEAARLQRWLQDLAAIRSPDQWAAVQQAYVTRLNTAVSTAERTASEADYVAALPRVRLARDPITSAVLDIAVDTAGLDGPFWDADAAVRPVEDQLPNYLLTTGAMMLSDDRLPRTDHLCKPGPAVPFVVPDLLERGGVAAVLSQLAVGPHVGYAISYFGPTPQPDPLPNEWGRNVYWRRDNGRPVTLGESYDTLPAPDFDLRRWVQRHRLAWIAPGDNGLTLRYGTDGCPYLDLPGQHRMQRLQAGRLW